MMMMTKPMMTMTRALARDTIRSRAHTHMRAITFVICLYRVPWGHADVHLDGSVIAFSFLQRLGREKQDKTLRTMMVMMLMMILSIYKANNRAL